MLLVLSLLGACGGPAAPGKPAPAAPPLLVGYYLPRGGSVPYGVDDVERSGAAKRLTHLVYAFGAVTGGRCAGGDGAEFGRLRALKEGNPGLKLLWSFGGYNGSAGFTDAARDPGAFAASCKAALDDPRWAGLFDGIDLDWEYPNSCGATCDTSGPDALARVTAAMRAALGPSRLVTAAITADATDGGRLGRAGYAAAAGSLDWVMAMTYDYAGTGDPAGPTAPHAALRAYPGEHRSGTDADAAIGRLRREGVPAAKILLGVGFYGRGWAGVTQDAPGGAASGPAPGGRGPGAEDYRVLRAVCPPTGTAGGQAYARCGGQWWSYDTPETLAGKAAYAREQGLGGVFCWELGGDTPDGALLGALQAALG